MKKGFTILIAFIMLASGIRVSINLHYCGGQLAEAKVSLSGSPASCGMETHEDSCTDLLSAVENCCEDQSTLLGVSSNYIPEYFNHLFPANAKEIPSFSRYDERSGYTTALNLYSSVLPPGDHLLKTEPLLSMICVLRI